MNIQKTELSLIADDIATLLQLVLDIRAHESSGYLALALSPLIGFVSEESHKYLNRHSLIAEDPVLFKSFDLAITKLRALLKLFDDTDGGKDGLIKTLQLFQQKSAQWMDVGKNRWQRILSRSLQPDLGVYFIGDELLYPSIVGFSASGLTRIQIEQLEDKDFASLSQNTFDFSLAAGNFLTQILEDVLRKHVAVQTNFNSRNLGLSSPITHNDFFSKQIYEEVANRAQLVKSQDAIVLLYVLSQVNVAFILLPQILSQQSNLLFRLQFLMAYHAVASLDQLPTKANSSLIALMEKIRSLPNLQNERKVRNVLAHYGFGEGQKFLVNTVTPLDQIIEGFSGQNRSAVDKLIYKKLSLISDWTREILSKHSLAKFRATLGDHT